MKYLYAFSDKKEAYPLIRRSIGYPDYFIAATYSLHANVEVKGNGSKKTGTPALLRNATRICAQADLSTERWPSAIPA